MMLSSEQFGIKYAADEHGWQSGIKALTHPAERGAYVDS